MNNGKDLSFEIKNFLETNPKNTTELPAPTRKIKQLEKEVKFHAKLANNYLERLQSLEAELGNKELEITEAKTFIQQLKKETSKLLAEKDKQITLLNSELNNTQQNSHFLTSCDGNLLTKRQNFIQILTANLPAELIKEELGDIYQGWENDLVLQVLTAEDKQKIAAYDNLKEQLTKLEGKLEKIKGLKFPKIKV